MTMSPYIVMVKSDLGPPSSNGYKVDSRRAVATLDEAQQAMRDALYERIPRHERTETSLGYDREAYWFTLLRGEANDLPEAGGTVGPLPDGTVIEVERVGWTNLYHALKPFPPEKPLMAWENAEIIAAYNGAQGGDAA